MKNPFRSEADAFRFVWWTIGYFALIVLGSLINVWLGVAVFVVVSLVALWCFFRRTEPAPPIPQAPAASPAGEHRILVAANETVGGPELLSEIRERSEGRRAVVLVLFPALHSPLKHWVWDEAAARSAAKRRLDASLDSMRAVGLDARGEIG